MPARLVAALAALLIFSALPVAASPKPLPQPDITALGIPPTTGLAPRAIGFGAGGRFYVAGQFLQVSGQQRSGIARFQPDGTLDPWNPAMPALGAVMAEEDGAGNVIVAMDSGVGYYVPASGQQPVKAFDGHVMSMAFDAMGNLYTASGTCFGGIFQRTPAVIQRYTGGLALDPGFSLTIPAPNTESPYAAACVTSMLVHAGHLYIGYNGGVFRVDAASGQVDTTWTPLAGDVRQDTQAKLTWFPQYRPEVRSIRLGSDGFLYMGGIFSVQGVTNLGRFSATPPGAPDTTWKPRIGPYVMNLALDEARATIYASGTFGVVEDLQRAGTAAFSMETGAAYLGWNPLLAPAGSGAALAIASDRVMLLGYFDHVTGEPRRSIAAVPFAQQTASAGYLKLSPAVFDFGTSIEPSTRTRTFTLSNPGQSPAGIASIDWVISNSLSSQVTVSHDCPSALAASAQCAISLTTTVSKDAGPYGNLRVQPADGSSAQFAWPAPVAYSIPPQPTFEETPYGGSRTRQYTLINGDAPLTIEGVGIAGGSAEWSVTSDCVRTLEPGAACTISLTYAPAAIGTMSPVEVAVVSQRSGPRIYTQGSGRAFDTDADGMPDWVEIALGYNPAVKDNDVLDDGQLFAMQLYRDFLNREGDAGGVDFWAAAVDGGVYTRPEVVRGFMWSAEFESRVAPVARLYYAFFSHPPDSSMFYWISAYQSGSTLELIAETFALQGSFTTRTAGLDNGGFVDWAYANVLGRAPDAGGRQYWKQRLDSLSITRPHMIAAFAQSPENRARTETPVLVTMSYVGLLRRAPDKGGHDFWVSYIHAGYSPLELIGGFIGSPEYRGRFLP